MKSIRNRSRQERDRPKGRPIGAVSKANWREIKEVAQRECPHEVPLNLPLIYG
jgi:hypothetical protein